MDFKPFHEPIRLVSSTVAIPAINTEYTVSGRANKQSQLSGAKVQQVQNSQMSRVCQAVWEIISNGDAWAARAVGGECYTVCGTAVTVCGRMTKRLKTLRHSRVRPFPVVGGSNVK